jgi:hypothetical protein
MEQPASKVLFQHLYPVAYDGGGKPCRPASRRERPKFHGTDEDIDVFESGHFRTLSIPI